MKVLFKVVRSQMPHEFRLGLEASSCPIDLNAASEVIIRGVLPKELHLNPQSIYYKNDYGSIDCKEIGDWIKNNGWGHQADAPMVLLKFNFSASGSIHVYEFVGKSNYKRISKQNKYLIDVPNDQDKLNVAW